MNIDISDLGTIIAIPATILTIIYLPFLIRRQRLECRKLQLEIVERELNLKERTGNDFALDLQAAGVLLLKKYSQYCWTALYFLIPLAVLFGLDGDRFWFLLTGASAFVVNWINQILERQINEKAYEFRSNLLKTIDTEFPDRSD